MELYITAKKIDYLSSLLHQNIAWNFDTLSKHPSITWDIVKANKELPWNYAKLSRNPNITWDIIQANPDKEWDYNNLSYNPNIGCDIPNQYENETDGFMVYFKHSFYIKP